jgi:hypothetical protein
MLPGRAFFQFLFGDSQMRILTSEDIEIPLSHRDFLTALLEHMEKSKLLGFDVCGDSEGLCLDCELRDGGMLGLQ